MNLFNAFVVALAIAGAGSPASQSYITPASVQAHAIAAAIKNLQQPLPKTSNSR